jgi:hypothetical protein
MSSQLPASIELGNLSDREWAAAAFSGILLGRRIEEVEDYPGGSLLIGLEGGVDLLVDRGTVFDRRAGREKPIPPLPGEGGMNCSLDEVLECRVARVYRRAGVYTVGGLIEAFEARGVVVRKGGEALPAIRASGEGRRARQALAKLFAGVGFDWKSCPRLRAVPGAARKG